MSSLLKIFIVAYTTASALAATYSQTDSHIGSDFLNAFSLEAISDPTHGRVNYVDAGTAASQNLTFTSSNTFIMRADFKKTLDPNGPGRNSVRMMSNKQYTTSVMVFNIRHMPQGCGTWPAVWTVGADWPNQGEIDILEGVNDQGPDQVTLHTGNGGCTMPSSRSQTGSIVGDDCDTADTNNAGCSVKVDDSRSYGPTFNSNGGGWYAVERTNSFIKVWFWARNAGGIPSDVSSGSTTVDTDNWGTPRAFFPSTSCSISEKFGPHNIIFDCGDWAGAVYGNSGCPSTCVGLDFVNNNPSAFTNAYFDFAWLKIYT
ncbi:putative glycosidase C21B10.07 [Psilocybe cubensis]|uniref:Glycosidase C21B10.07 n=1 Tax=Psilocybe cubensis TaxID=181762 RepID=A0ACB8GSJ0_PSICU|nr:putative glycosidase C21B10.07 [Psilocybe cubensis]KAH9478613.1 putative glycosidase C21B10.07 [Psilocybe cubensis]